MAAPVYTTDLQNISLAQVTTGWTNIGTGAPVAETDYFINGSACIAKGGWQSAVRGNIFDFGSNITINSPNAVFIWETYWFPNLMDSEAAGGQRVIVGSASTAYRNWYVRGADTHQYGGWIPQVVDPNVAGDSDVGSPSAGAFRWFGGSCSIIAAGGTPKGNPFGIGAVRWGREFQNSEGESADPATFSGGATFSNDINRRWGQVFLRDGAYFVQGAFVMGLAGTAVYFSDSNKAVFILNTKKVTAGFNEFVVRNAASTVNWTNISVTALSTVSRGKFTVEANAAVTLETCTFTDMDTFTFLSSTSALNCTFRRCNAVTATGSDLRGSGFRTPTVTADASGLVWTDTTETDGLLDNATFSKGTNAHHAISFASTTTDVDYTLRNIDFSGFNATPASNDSAIYVAATTGTITIYLIGCSGNITAKSAGATVTFISDPVTVTVTTKDVNGDPVGSANVFLKAASGGSGILPVNATIDTITWSGGTATATHAAVHNMSTGDQVHIKGADQAEYNGIFTITFVNTTQYTYATSDPGGSATGTITGTFVFLKGTTHVTTGILSMSRVIAADQNVIGWARKSTASPFYKTASISGTVLATGGLTATAVLIVDE